MIDADMLATMLRNGYQELLSRKEIINNLNVFPVPDGDTGLNMSRTMQGGIESLEEGLSSGLLLKRFAKGSLMSARGNSGVILSQFIRGLAKDLKISVITTLKAYEMLEQEGLVTAVQGKGYYVNAQDTQMLMEQHRRKVEDALLSAIHSARLAGMTQDELVETLQTLMKIDLEG